MYGTNLFNLLINFNEILQYHDHTFHSVFVFAKMSWLKCMTADLIFHILITVGAELCYKHIMMVTRNLRKEPAFSIIYLKVLAFQTFLKGFKRVSHDQSWNNILLIKKGTLSLKTELLLFWICNLRVWTFNTSFFYFFATAVNFLFI